MKKYRPLILFLVGLVVIVGVFFIVKNKSKSTGEDEESALIEVPLEKRPVVSLTPSEDGHWLTLKVEKIVIEAASMDYELIYQVPGGPTQGVPGTFVLQGKQEFETELLLGSESSGKFRYDEGVEQGTLTIRFRNEKGKLMAKFATDFHLQSDSKELTSLDGKFAYVLDKKPKSGFFVVMETFGFFDNPPKEVQEGPYGLFSSLDSSELDGSVEIGSSVVYRHVTGPRWEIHEEGDEFTSDSGIFVGTSE